MLHGYKSKFLHKLSIFAYGFPFLVVMITAGVTLGALDSLGEKWRNDLYLHMHFELVFKCYFVISVQFLAMRILLTFLLLKSRCFIIWTQNEDLKIYLWWSIQNLGYAVEDNVFDPYQTPRSHISTYRSARTCFLHSFSAYFGFFLPIGAMFTANIVIFFKVLSEVARKKSEVSRFQPVFFVVFSF